MYVKIIFQPKSLLSFLIVKEIKNFCELLKALSVINLLYLMQLMHLCNLLSNIFFPLLSYKLYCLPLPKFLLFPLVGGTLSFPDGSAMKNMPAMQKIGIDPWVGKIPWRRQWQLTPVSLPGKSHGQRSLAGYRPWGRKEQNTTEQLNTHI